MGNVAENNHSPNFENALQYVDGSVDSWLYVIFGHRQCGKTTVWECNWYDWLTSWGLCG